MEVNNRQVRKLYALRRMGAAIDRAMRSPAPGEKNHAMRWAAAWGLLAGIRSASVRLRNSQMLAAE